MAEANRCEYQSNGLSDIPTCLHFLCPSGTIVFQDTLSSFRVSLKLVDLLFHPKTNHNSDQDRVRDSHCHCVPYMICVIFSPKTKLWATANSVNCHSFVVFDITLASVLLKGYIVCRMMVYKQRRKNNNDGCLLQM